MYWKSFLLNLLPTNRTDQNLLNIKPKNLIMGSSLNSGKKKQVTLSPVELLKISHEISEKFTPKRATQLTKAKPKKLYSSAELLKISDDISHYYAPKMSSQKNYLRLLSVDPRHIYVYWNLNQSNNNTLLKTMHQNELTLRIYEQTEFNTAPIPAEPVIEMPVHNFQYQKKLTIPTLDKPSCFSAYIGECIDKSSFNSLVESNELHIDHNSAFISPLEHHQEFEKSNLLSEPNSRSSLINRNHSGLGK